MKYRNNFFFALCCIVVLLAGCDKSTDAGEYDDSILLEDAAESISAAMGDESGGATESFADVMIAGGEGSMGAAAPAAEGSDLVSAGIPVYDSLTGWWSVSVNRSRIAGMIERTITREYRYQFQKNGVWQKRRITGNDTATTLKFRIVSGTGRFIGLRVSHALTMLKGAWTTNDLNKDTVKITLDSTYVRSGTDTITTRLSKRTHTSTLTITAANVRARRFRPSEAAAWREEFPNAISGTISGHYTAAITFERGDLYRERSVDKDFTITFSGGKGSLDLGGKFGRFSMNMKNGQRNSP